MQQTQQPTLTTDRDRRSHDRVSEILAERKGDLTYGDFAYEIGMDPSMLRAILTNRSRPGYGTLCTLMAWDPETFKGLIVDQMLIEGRRLREEFRSDG